ATGNTTEFVSGLTEVNVRNGGALINTNGFDVTIPTPLFHSNIGGDSATDGGLVKNGSGTLTLDFDNSGDPYTGATIVNGGTLSIGSSGYVETNVTANSGSSVGGTGTLAGSLTTNAGSALTNDLTGPLLVDGAVDFAGATGLVFTDAPANGVTYDLIDYTFGSVSNVGNLASTTARVTIGNTGSKITGTVTTGTRTWSTTSGTWEINGAANFLEGDQKFFNGDTVVFNNPAAPSTVTLNGNLVPVSVSVTNTNDYTFAGAGSITGTAVLTKAGGGNLTIGNSNAHTGGTTIDGGSISISGSSNLGDASGLLTINAGTLKVTADVTSTRAVSLGNAASTIEVDPTFTYSAGTFSGTGNLTKTGSGTLAITGSPSHTGSTLVSAGALRVANGTFSGGTGVTTNASLEYDVTSAQTETAAIGGTGTLTRTGSNILTLANQSNSYTGQTIITGTGSGGTLAVAADEVIPDASELVLSNGGKLQLGLGAGISSTETIAGLSAAHSGATLVQASESGSSPAMLSTLVINTATATTYDFGGFIRKRGSADVSITKSGPGTQILSNTSNSYTGVTTINAGTLQLGNGTDDGTIGSTSGVVNNGTLAFNNTGSRTANYVISGTGSVTKSSGGTMTLNGVNTYTGDTVINAGTLAVNGTSIDDSVKVDIVGGKMALTNTETVNSLYFGGVEQASGTWGATGSGATHIDDARFSGTGVLSVTTGFAGSPYDAWSGGAAFAVDTNGDGVTNGMAWLLGAASPSANAVGLLPVASQSGGGLVLTFNCLNAANRGTAVLNVGHSSDLGILDAWTYAAVTDVDSGPTNGVTFVVTPGSPTNAVTATISSTEGAAGKLFGHLKGTK
ncbi:MAG: autotransporter-associated beta strand repeat-containing protein, partial [Verrucomicrobiae bacterium]|nr:autotransporter-associated beta strand repeat-containing protein [Verrucomicrobiae bacterium]